MNLQTFTKIPPLLHQQYNDVQWNLIHVSRGMTCLFRGRPCDGSSATRSPRKHAPKGSSFCRYGDGRGGQQEPSREPKQIRGLGTLTAPDDILAGKICEFFAAGPWVKHTCTKNVWITGNSLERKTMTCAMIWHQIWWFFVVFTRHWSLLICSAMVWQPDGVEQQYDGDRARCYRWHGAMVSPKHIKTPDTPNTQFPIQSTPGS